MELSAGEQKQYSRHLILESIGKEGQLKLKKAKILIIGAGGLGTPILQYLTAAGIGTLGIIDHDRVDQSNLQRQIIYTHQDLGKYKAKVAAERMALLNPFIHLKPYTSPLTKENAIDLFAQYDIIVDGSDNFPTRYLVNDAAVLTQKPVVFGAIFKFEGQVSVYNHDQGPTYRCLFPKPPKPDQVPNCSEIGVLGVLAGIIGNLQANEALKMVLGIGEVLSGKLLVFNALDLQQRLLHYGKNPSISVTALDRDYESFCGVPKDTSEISWEMFQEQKEDFNMLDVRTYEEREEAHIGGLHIPLDELEDRIGEIQKNKKLLVYCKSGVRGRSALKIIEEQGFKKALFNLEGGLQQV